MNLIKYQPRFPESRFGNLIDDFFNKSISDVVGSDFTMNLPALNVVEQEDQFVLDFAVPGLQKEDFHVQIEEDRLMVSANVESQNEVTEGKFTRREFNYQSFQRSFQLPENVDQENIFAAYENGVLKVTLPKLAKSDEVPGRRNIEIS